MTTPPKVLVLGAGSAGTRHARNLEALGARVTVVDTDPASGGIPNTLAGHDGIVVATPSGLHRDHTLLALESGAAAVLVEKPLATSTDGLDDLVAAAGDRVTVGYNLRLHEPVQRLRDLLDAGTAGTVAHVHAWFGSWLPDWRPGTDHRRGYSARADLGGGVLWDASHELDLLVWLFGPTWSVEGAVLATRSDVGVDVEDVAIALLRSGDGVPATVRLDYVSRQYRRGLEVVGDDATVRLDWADGSIAVERADGVAVEAADAPIDGSYEREAAAFLALVRGEAPPLVSAADAAVTVRLCAAIRDAAAAP